MASSSQGSFPCVTKLLGRLQLDSKSRSTCFIKRRVFSEFNFNQLQRSSESMQRTWRHFSSSVHPGSVTFSRSVAEPNKVCSSQCAGDIHILGRGNIATFSPLTAFHQTRHLSGRSPINSPTRYYDVLGLSPGATQHQIKSAYYNMSKLYHPDVAKGSKSHMTFTEITEAYEVLGNIRKRRMYDRGIYTRNNFQSPDHEADYTAAYQQKATNSPFERGDRPPPPRGRTNVYNFDEFYRQHYNDIRERRANEYKEFVQHQENMRGGGPGGGEGIYYGRQSYQQLVLVLVSLFVLGTLAISLENYDKDLIGSSRTGNSHPNYYGLRDPLRRIPVAPSDDKDDDSS